MLNNDCGNDIVDNLLSDESFRNWVLNPDSESDLFWKSWLTQNPEKKEAVKQARIIFQSLQFEESRLSDKESSFLLRRIKNTNAFREERNSEETIVRQLNDCNNNIQQNRGITPFRYLLRYTAILGGAIIFALSVHLISGGMENESGVQQVEGAQYIERVNSRGQKATLFLPDGSLVTLNSSSKLVYPKEFKNDIREVYLRGEAFFEVQKDSKPFIVKTDDLEARVLGTSFNVRALPDKEEYSVSLVTGKVLVSPSEGDQGSLMLEPGEKGERDSRAATLVKTEFDSEQELAWKEGILFFKNLPFEEALHRIEEWYGVDLVMIGQVPGKGSNITGRFDNESLENVLKSIGFTVRFDYQINGNKVYLNFKS